MTSDINNESMDVLCKLLMDAIKVNPGRGPWSCPWSIP